MTTTFPILANTIRCPHCGHVEPATMPTDSCQVVFVCPVCQNTLRPLPGDCCVFCSYGSRPCPSIQLDSKRNEGHDIVS
jgi:hypothetical protein